MIRQTRPPPTEDDWLRSQPGACWCRLFATLAPTRPGLGDDTSPDESIRCRRPLARSTSPITGIVANEAVYGDVTVVVLGQRGRGTDHPALRTARHPGSKAGADCAPAVGPGWHA